MPKTKAACALVVLGCLAAGVASPRAHATVQEESCIAPDIEYPVPCDDDE